MSSARALKPALSLRPSTNRPGMGSRASSQGSIRSLSRSGTPTASPSATCATSEARCYFSIPSASSAATTAAAASGAGDGSTTATPLHTGSPAPSQLASASESPKRIGRSRPIAIELGSSRRSQGPADTPPEPLSARGDFHGGYFPLHENVNRSYSPHPFASPSTTTAASSHNNAIEVSALHQLTATSASGTAPSDLPSSNTKPPLQAGVPEPALPFFGTYTPYGHSVIESPSANASRDNLRREIKQKLQAKESFQFTARPPRRPAPGASNHSSMGIAQGKYHPSHYKAPTMSAPHSTTSPTSKIGSMPPLSSGSPLMGAVGMVPQTAEGIKIKLLQYQQDMREQAAAAARLQVPVRLPPNPKLAPLGSPGPVTPWELDGEGGGYPGFGRAVAGEKR